MNSITRRLTLASNAVLVFSLTLIGFSLERTYRESVVTRASDQLRPVIYALMGSAEEDAGFLNFADGVSQPRLQQPDSGMYALVADRVNGVLWRSPSLAIAAPALDRQISAYGLQARLSAAGVFSFDAIRGAADLYCLSNEIFWEGLETPEVIFNVCVDQAPYQALIERFRMGLVTSFAVLLLLLSLVLVLALRWGMRPLRHIQDQLRELEQGDRRQLEEVQPKELLGLVASLNRFVMFEAAQRKRHRQALDDLAHSLKTPLSVLGLGINRKPPDLPLLQDQVSRMQGIVDHQLSRVARIAQSESAVDRPWVSVEPVVRRLIRALSVGYADNEFEYSAHAGFALRVHEDDLLDILGNVLENACKHGARRIRITIGDPAEAASKQPPANNGLERQKLTSQAVAGDAVARETVDRENVARENVARKNVATETTGTQRTDSGLVLCIEDDGPGIEPTQVASALSRGARLDSQAPGQGIGLAMVVELLAAYGGSADIQSSDLGGAAVSLYFPHARLAESRS